MTGPASGPTEPDQATRHAQDLLSAAVITAFRLNGQFLALAEDLGRPAGLTPTWWQVLGAVLGESTFGEEALASAVATPRAIGRAGRSPLGNGPSADGFGVDGPGSGRGSLSSTTLEECPS